MTTGIKRKPRTQPNTYHVYSEAEASALIDAAFTTHGAALTGYVRSRIRPLRDTDDLADDLVQDIFVAVWKRLRTGTYDSRRPLKSLLYETASYAVQGTGYEAPRLDDGTWAAVSTPAHEDPVACYERRETIQACRRLLALLPRVVAEMCQARLIDGVPWRDELARAVGIDPADHTRFYAAKYALKSFLALAKNPSDERAFQEYRYSAARLAA